MRKEAAQLKRPSVERYVEARAIDLDRQTAEVSAGLEGLAALSRLELE